MQIETWCYHYGEEWISIIKIGAMKCIQPMELNKTVIEPDVFLIIGNRPTLLQYGKEDVVLYK